MTMTGVLIGAGFSHEYGMPMVRQLTKELLDYLTTDKLRNLNKEWILQGGGYSEDVIEEFAEKLNTPNMHYEQIIGWLQIRSLQERGKRGEEFHGLYVWMVELIGWILYFRHVKNYHYLAGSVPFYRGIDALTDGKEPLWIFSLNHDLCIEMLAGELGIPLRTGFHSEIMTLPRRNEQGGVIGKLRLNSLDRNRLSFEGMNFFKQGERGINLLKLHGSLDTFLYLDETLYVKILPKHTDTRGWLETLKQVNSELIYLLNGQKRKVTNEIAFADFDGEMQFLRRTLLAGEYKFDNRISSNTPPELLKVFGEALTAVYKLIIIGYGFEDKHINGIIIDWLRTRLGKRVLIVDPFRESIPECLMEYAPVVTIKRKPTTEWLDTISGNVLSDKEKDLKMVRSLGPEESKGPSRRFTKTL